MKAITEKNKKLIIRIACLVLAVCLMIGTFEAVILSGVFNTAVVADDTVYLRGTSLYMNDRVLYDNVTVTEDRQLVLDDGYVLMENVTVDSDGSLYGKVNPIGE